MNEDFSIRPARPDDGVAVKEFTARLFDGHDYVIEEWDEWLEDCEGHLLVGTLEDDPVAMIKISNLGDGDGWLHGLRVMENARLRGYGKEMVSRALQIAQQEGFRTIRFMTNGNNTAVHHIAAELGFRPVAGGTGFLGRPSHTRSAIVPLDEGHYDWLLEQVEQSPELGTSGGFYAFRWRYYTLSPARLYEHLQMGEIYALSDSDAWAIADLDEPAIGFAQGPPEELADLLGNILSHPDLEGDELYVLAEPNGAMAAGLLAAGYRQEDYTQVCYQWFGDPSQEAR